MAGNTLLELRRDTAANWTAANPTLASGEPGLETDTGKLKLGDGSTAWTSLPYFGNPNVQSVASAATVTPTFKNDMVKITALAAACQLLNWTGLAAEGWGLVVRIKDAGTAKALTYDTKYRAMGTALPTTTVISKTMYLAFIYDLTDDKFDLVSVAQEA